MDYMIEITPRSERQALVEKRLEASSDFGEKIYEFRGASYTPKVISVPVDLPVYRLENCRTFSAQQTEIARNGRGKNFFTKGQEQATAQQIQHSILVKISEKKEASVAQIMDVLRKDGQREPLLMTSTGVIVNGNRRLCAMREMLYQPDGAKDKRFENVLCAVLPSDITRDEIDDIEADLQARPQARLDYDWIGDAQLVRRQIAKGRSIKEVADRLRRSKKDIEGVLHSLDEVDLYLSEWLEKPGEYELVSDGQQIFNDIPKSVLNKPPKLQDACRGIAWSIFDNRERISGRVYRLNAAFGKLSPKVLEILEEELELPSVDDDRNDEIEFEVEIDIDDTTKSYTPVIEALKDGINNDYVVDTLIEACETAIQLDKGLQSEQAVLRTLAQINSKLMGLDVSSAGTSTLPSLLKHIESIRGELTRIESDIEKRQQGK